jgi:hypothetical protein
MSLFQTTNLPCPSCGQPVEFQVVHSVNADRRPDLRSAVQQGAFQRQDCGSCKTTFRLDPHFTYLDLGRHQWIAVHPLDDIDRWRELEAQVQGTYDLAFGQRAPAAARALGKGIVPRLVFGWPALEEKLAVHDHGLDDVQVELFKVGLLKVQPESPLGEETELRFLEVPPDGPQELALAWLDGRTAGFLEGLRVPRELYDQIGADPEAWEDLRSQLGAGLFVDMKRLITVGA